MDYKKLYDTFIAERIAHPTGDIRAQIHHIVPIEHGGSNEISNLVRLSIRDHIFAHKVLGRMGMCATATKKMSRAVAAGVMASLPGTVSAHGRVKTPRKRLNSYLAQSQKKLDEIGDRLGDSLVDLCKDCAPGYALYFANGKKYHTLFNAFIAKIRDFILFKIADNEEGDEETGLAMFPGASDAEEKPVEEKLPECPFPCIVITRNGKPFMRTTIKPGVNTIEDICRPAHKNFILGLYYRYTGPACKKFFDGLCDGTVKDQYLDFYLSDRITREQFANESRKFGIPALKYALAKVTGCKAGTYALEDIVSEAVKGIRMLLVQNIILEHLEDGGWKTLDFDNDWEARGLKTRVDDMMNDPESIYFPTHYEFAARMVLGEVVKSVAFTDKRRNELVDLALPMLVDISGTMMPTYHAICQKCHMRIDKYEFARAFFIKNSIRAIQKLAGTRKEYMPRWIKVPVVDTDGKTQGYEFKPNPDFGKASQCR